MQISKFILASVLLLGGCANFQQTKTDWIKQSTPYPVSVIEYGDLRAALAADFSAGNLTVTRTDDTFTVSATDVGAARSPVLAELPAALDAMRGQIEALSDLVSNLAATVAKRLIIP